MRKLLKIIIVILVIYILGLTGYVVYDKVLKKDSQIQEKPTDKPTDEPVVAKSNEFNYNLILNNHAIAEKNKNYLISPYSIEMALSMLRDGANGETKTEIEKVIGTRKMNDVTSGDKINVANALFMKDKWENEILSNFKNNLKTNYNAEMILDEFKTPDKINAWVKEKTKGMIDKVVDSVDGNFVLGLANALAIDVEWQSQFECDRTRSEEFTKADGSKINVEMMHSEAYQYIKENDVEGIVLPYKKVNGSNVELEFIGLIPTGDLDSYINNNLEKDLKNMNSLIKVPKEGEVDEVRLNLPRFTYDSEMKSNSNPNLFKTLLQNMGIRKAFIPAGYYGDKTAAEFENMADIKAMITKDPSITGLYVGTAVHKTHIELMEKGTKAAAVTFFGIDAANAMPVEKKYIDIKFDKPFVYVIREKNTGEMLFFGVVNEPNLWNGSTCSNNEG